MDEGITVTSPSGAVLKVMNEEEKEYFERISERYYADNLIVNISDQQDLDRVLLLEVIMFRWGIWISSEHDYDGNPIDPADFRTSLSNFSTEARQLKKMLGIDKKSREGDGATVADYIENLKLRAEEFGIMRNEQAVKAILLFEELSAFHQLMVNADDIERYENKCGPDDLIKWIGEYAIPEYEKIDEAFRATSQKYWIAEI